MSEMDSEMTFVDLLILLVVVFIGAAAVYFMPGSWWPKVFLIGLWQSAVSEFKANWIAWTIVSAIVGFYLVLRISVAIQDFRHPPHHFTWEDFE